ncbi:MAG: hypothetical protein IKF41_02070 [Alphaproteobacteria bacterium]|nr:hypothetical protein [Alphaproteobacteria bacterium]
MKSLSRILTVLFCCAPFAYAGAAGTVATTAGSNLTAYNPSNAQNNQWATLSNGRYDATNNTSAKADFGNCNALILRCAQPKCANGGCADASVAAAIVKGCVQSNKACVQYGDDLIEYMTAQLVANSNAKINEQNLAAAAAAQQQSEQQIQQMQYQMQQMQQQMVQQQAESAQQMQAALEQQAAQNAAALAEMKSAATEAAKETEAGISAYQQDAINRGVSEDVLTRQTITGQIMTEIENAETSLKEVKVAMNTAFEYAKCDARGNSCSGPKRVKKWRELAREFSDPYNNTIDKIYDALMIAQTVGIDLSQIYMMLNDSCNQWGQYLCPQMSGGQIVYPSTADGQKGTPKVCKEEYYSCIQTDCKDKTSNDRAKCESNCAIGCQPCTLVKVLTESKDDQDAVYEGWVNAEYSTDKGNISVVACASGALDSAKLFARRTRTKNGANLVDMDMLELWLDQIGADKDYENAPGAINYCSINEIDSMKYTLRNSTLSKSVDTDKMYCSDIKTVPVCGAGVSAAEASYINPIYAICDAHKYNSGKIGKDELKSDEIEEMKEIIGLKTTVISQQMYKQYEYLNATLRRLKTQLEKATLTATLEAAGAKTEGSSSSSSGGLLGGNSSNDDKTIHLAGAENCSNLMDFDSAYNCLQKNVALIKTNITTNPKKACLQLQETVASADAILSKEQKTWEACKAYKDNAGTKSCRSSVKTDLNKCADEINFAVMREKRYQTQQNRNTANSK